MRVRFLLQGKGALGTVVLSNDKTVWIKLDSTGELVKRHREKHRVKQI